MRVLCEVLGFAKAVEEAGEGLTFALVAARERIAEDRCDRRDQLLDAGAVRIPTSNEGSDMGDRLRPLRVEPGILISTKGA